MYRRKKLAVVAIWSAAVVILALSVWRMGQQQRFLSHLAHRVGRLPGAIRLQGAPRPQWLSDHEAIYLSYHPDGDRFEFTSFNTENGDHAPMEELNSRFAHELRSKTVTTGGNPAIHEPPEYVLSPSGNLLLIATTTTAARMFGSPTVYHLTDTKASTDLTWQFTSIVRQPPIWLHDGKRCVQPVNLNYTAAQVFNIDTPSTPKQIGARPLPPHWVPIASTSRNTIWGIVHSMNSTEVTEWDVLEGKTLPTLNIELPVRGFVYGAAVSTDGDRAAWLVLYNPETPISRLLYRIHPTSGYNTLDHIGIWTSNLDGSNMKEVGLEDISRFNYNDNYIQWLPGGKKLAFHLGMDLYTVAVDR